MAKFASGSMSPPTAAEDRWTQRPLCLAGLLLYWGGSAVTFHMNVFGY